MHDAKVAEVSRLSVRQRDEDGAGKGGGGEGAHPSDANETTSRTREKVPPHDRVEFMPTCNRLACRPSIER